MRVAGTRGQLLLSALKEEFPHVPEPIAQKYLEDAGFDLGAAERMIREEIIEPAAALDGPERRHSEDVDDGPDAGDIVELGPPAAAPAGMDYTRVFPTFESLFTASYGHGGKRVDSEKLSRAISAVLHTVDLWERDVAASEANAVEEAEWRAYKIQSSRPEVTQIVHETLRRVGMWTEEPALGNNFNLLWSWTRPKVAYQELLACQRVNHFPNVRQLTRKDLLKRHLARYTNIPGKIGDAFTIMPTTYLLPKEYLQFMEDFSERRDDEEDPNIWIMKPVSLSRGRGISVINDIGDIHYGDDMVIQKYVHRPMLINGYKFDLRLYVLVTSFCPLEVFLYNEGFVRLSTGKYSIDPTTLKDLFVHLTNSSVQKNSSAKEVLAGAADAGGGTKASLAFFRELCEGRGIDFDNLWNKIALVILKSLMSVQDEIAECPNSFELFGYDILIDEDLRPWLIEVNSSPAMAQDHPIDRKIKSSLMEDTLRLVDPLNFDRTVLKDLIERQFPSAGAKRRGRTSQAGSVQRHLNDHLHRLFRGQVPRAVHEMPAHLGNYKRIAPSRLSEHLAKFKR